MYLKNSKFFHFDVITEVPTPPSAKSDRASKSRNGSFSIEDKPEFQKLLSSSPPQMSPVVADGDPPEPEELIKAIQVSTI